MLSNVRIRDNRRLALVAAASGARKEKPEVGSRRRRARRTVEDSPFLQLVHDRDRAACSSPSSDGDIAAVVDCIRDWHLSEQSPVGEHQRSSLPHPWQVADDSLESPPQQQPEEDEEEIPAGAASTSPPAASPAGGGRVRRAVLPRGERRSLQELRPASPADSAATGRRRAAAARRQEVTPNLKTKYPHRSPLTPVTPSHPPSHLTLSSPLLSYLSPAHCLPLSPREKVLAFCEQTQPQPLSSYFTPQGQWEQFHPSTNILWLTFLVHKLSQRATELGSPASRRSWRAELRPLARSISKLSSAKDAFLNLFLSQK